MSPKIRANVREMGFRVRKVDAEPPIFSAVFPMPMFPKRDGR